MSSSVYSGELAVAVYYSFQNINITHMYCMFYKFKNIFGIMYKNSLRFYGSNFDADGI